MKASTAQAFRLQAKQAHSRYKQTNNWDEYMADSAYIALSLAAAYLAESNPGLRHLKPAVSTAQHGIKAMAHIVSEDLRCPVDSDHDHEDFLQHLWRHGKEYIERDVQPVKDVFACLGIK